MAAPRLYVPSRPALATPEALSRYLFEELGRISLAFDGLRSNLTLDELHVAPPRPVKGMIVLADGTNWNPGSGAGYYGYDGSAWVYFGTGAVAATADMDELLLMGG